MSDNQEHSGNYILPYYHMNGMQRNTLKKFLRMAAGSNFINIQVRYEGQYYEFEGDMLKHLIPIEEYKELPQESEGAVIYGTSNNSTTEEEK